MFHYFSKSVRLLIRRTPVIREVFLFLWRGKIVLNHLAAQVWSGIVWLFSSKEFANFTYDLTDGNKRHLAALISNITGENYETIESYMVELEQDSSLKDHVRTSIQNSEERHFADTTVHFGRRLGWYVLVRLAKPKIVVETGVDKGLGSCVLASALMKNDQEGYPGYYYGTDINPRSGYLLSGDYRRYGEILYGDSLVSLGRLEEKIDLFINDSDHSPDYEAKEYEAIAEKLSENAIIVGDNAHVTDRLLDFSLKTNRRFVFFRETPLNHWYPGAGIGISYRVRMQ